MIEQYSKQSLQTCLVLAFLFVVGCNGFSLFNTAEPTGRLPIQQISITIREENHQILFAQLKDFSKRHNLRYVQSLYNANERGERFSIVMYGDEFHIAVLSMLTTDQLDFAFTADASLTSPPQDVISNLYNDFKMELSEIPGVVILEEK